MKKVIIGILLTGAIATLSGCNNAAKQLGGTMEVSLPKGKKLINVTWKDADLWYLTRDMTESDKAETYEFKEKSNLGIAEGTVVIKETK